MADVRGYLTKRRADRYFFSLSNYTKIYAVLRNASGTLSYYDNVNSLTPRGVICLARAIIEPFYEGDEDKGELASRLDFGSDDEDDVNDEVDEIDTENITKGIKKTESGLSSFIFKKADQNSATRPTKGALTKDPIGFRLHTPNRTYVFGFLPESAVLWMKYLSLHATFSMNFDVKKGWSNIDKQEPDYAKPLISFARIPTTEFVCNSFEFIFVIFNVFSEHFIF